MDDDKNAPSDSDDDVADEDHERDRAAKHNAAHPGYSRYRKTRQFGG